MNLGMLKPGESGVISKLDIKGPLKIRLMDMGLIVGEKIIVKKVAPMGDPIEVVIKNYRLSLRKSEAEGIMLDCVPENKEETKWEA
ncbi:MAG: ferrous iron transport protein A [Nitrospirae bacterium]|nr:ferrous iron transport protein A [Nitrospirota bacterium]